MKKYLTSEEFEAVKTRIAGGHSSMTIPRSVARQFFTRVNNASVIEITGHSIRFQKFVIWTGVIGSLQATEAIKYLLGMGELLTDSLLTYDALRMDFRRLPAGRRADCALCGANATITTLSDEGKVSCNRKGCKC